MMRMKSLASSLLLPAVLVLVTSLSGCSEGDVGQLKRTQSKDSGDKSTLETPSSDRVARIQLERVAQGSGQGWGALKGRIVWEGDIPAPQELKVTTDQNHCLEGKGKLFDENLVVNPKNRGVRGAFVWLEAEGNKSPPVHPDLKALKQKQVEIDQPQCMFTPRSLAIREGMVVLVKNSAPVNHNIRWTGDPDINEGGSVIIQPKGTYEIKGLKAQRLPMMLECNIHPWMRGRLAVFDHPYYAVTDENGNFEIKNAPAGKFRLVVYQEAIGWRGGAKGRNGEEITIQSGMNDLKDKTIQKSK